MPSDSSDPVTPTLASNESTRKQKTQLKIIAILVLGLILAFVTQPGDESAGSSEDGAVPQLVSLKAKPVDASSKAPEVPNEFTTVTALPSLSIDEITSMDLFPRPMVQPADVVPETIVEPATHDRKITVKAIYGDASGGRKAAIINDGDTDRSKATGRIVRPGQPLPSGVQVMSISQDGLELAQ